LTSDFAGKDVAQKGSCKELGDYVELAGMIARIGNRLDERATPHQHRAPLYVRNGGRI
jgi:hypothetical protein